jgi:non-canonical (house-cleaning) NTP pyrophosphatase
LGAQNRLKNAKAALGGQSVDYLVSIENGIVEVNSKPNSRFFDLAWVVLEDAKTG